jgi:polysaccharide biosynthesis transport protein
MAARRRPVGATQLAPRNLACQLEFSAMLMMRSDQRAADGTLDRTDSIGELGYAHMQSPEKKISVGELQFHQVTDILRRRHRLILAIAGVGTMLAIMVGLLIPPKYTATAQLLVKIQDAGARDRAIDEIMDTHMTLISSRDHLWHVINSFSPSKNASDEVTEPVVPRPISTDPPFSLNELKERLNVWVKALRRPSNSPTQNLDEVERHTSAIEERRSRVISVAYTSTDPVVAAAFVNRIVQLYVDDLVKHAQANANDEKARLDARIAEARDEMEKAGMALRTALRQQLDGKSNGTGVSQGADGLLHELERHAGVSAQLYSNLLQRQKEMRQQQEIVSPGIEIHSLASIPNRPSSHNPILFIFPAFLVLMLGGSGFCILVERLDRGLRSEQDINDLLGIPCIGLVPQLPRSQRARPDLYLAADPFSRYAEAIRSVAATLEIGNSRSAIRGPKVILVTSSVPSEGKTTLSLSLAAYSVSMRRRVLLIDLDFNRTSILADLQGGSERGLIKFDHEHRHPAEFVQHIEELGLDYVAFQRRRVHLFATLSREEVSCWLRKLWEEYDCVIIDGRPLLGSIESRVLLSLVDRLLFVIRWGHTRRDLAYNALGSLRNSCSLGNGLRHSPIAILEQVDLKKHAKYRYGDIGECLIKYRRYYSRPMGYDSSPIKTPLYGGLDQHDGGTSNEELASAEESIRSGSL